MKKQLVSFRDFLVTGTLGPVIPGMKMIEIAEAFGAPMIGSPSMPRRFPSIGYMVSSKLPLITSRLTI
ncbi:hypothetical protein [Mesorhizobium sp. M0768]|uniref:hypothetical protein n=1 Tax=Mesorhizobium sp. M0768 TaxID=2956996 RepID=UPI0033380AF0